MNLTKTTWEQKHMLMDNSNNGYKTDNNERLEERTGCNNQW